MDPRIIKIEQKILVGMSAKMSLSVDGTSELWRQFGPRIKEISDRISNDKYSVQVYPSDYFKMFNPHTKYKKWAAVEVGNVKNIPDGMDTLIVDQGLYAVFEYKGLSSDNSIFQAIFSKWIPNSKYTIDHRPHFEILGTSYKNDDPESEEEIWIPIKVN